MNICITIVKINCINHFRFLTTSWQIILNDWNPQHQRVVISTSVLHSITNSQHLLSLNSVSCRESKGSKGHSVWNSFLNNQCACSYSSISKDTWEIQKSRFSPTQATDKITFTEQKVQRVKISLKHISGMLWMHFN